MSTHHVQLEAYFGVPVAGGMLHSLDPYLPADRLAHIINHSEDRFLIVDDVFLPVFERIWFQLVKMRLTMSRFCSIGFCLDAPGKSASAFGLAEHARFLRALPLLTKDLRPLEVIMRTDGRTGQEHRARAGVDIEPDRAAIRLVSSRQAFNGLASRRRRSQWALRAERARVRI